MQESRQDVVIEDAEIVMRLSLDGKGTILVNGQDISKQVQKVSLDMRAGEIATINLHCIAQKIDIEANGDIALRQFGQAPLLMIPRTAVSVPQRDFDKEQDEPAAL